MPDIILAICYQANREPTPDELGGFKDTAEDSLPDYYTNKEFRPLGRDSLCP